MQISLGYASKGSEEIAEGLLAHAAVADVGTEEGATDSIAHLATLTSAGGLFAHGQWSVS